MANNKMLRGHTEFYDGFELPCTLATNGLIASRHKYVLGTGTNDVSRLAINGGAVRMTGDTNEAADMALYGPLMFEPDECGLLILQYRIRVNTSIAMAAVFIGFTDIDSDTTVLSYEDAAVVSTPTDGFGILYEGEQSATAWYTIGVGNDVDDTVRLTTNIDPLVIATWVTVKIEAVNTASDGTVGTVMRYRVWIDEKLIETAATDRNGWTTSTARSSIVYCPVVARAGRGTAYTVDVCEGAVNAGVGASLD